MSAIIDSVTNALSGATVSDPAVKTEQGIKTEPGIKTEQSAPADSTAPAAESSKPINAATNEAVLASAEEGRRLYIGNLAYATTEGELKEFFKGYLV